MQVDLYIASTRLGSLLKTSLSLLLFSITYKVPYRWMTCDLTSFFKSTLKRNRNATLFQWKIDGVVVKVLDIDNEPSSFQEMPRNLTNYCLK